MANYSKTSTKNEPRVELHDILHLTGAEVSINTIPAGSGVPFIHAHKNNEEIYYILNGKGSIVLDNETVELNAGDWLRVAPEVKRQIHAGNDDAISFFCIQVKANSLDTFTMNDAIV